MQKVLTKIQIRPDGCWEWTGCRTAADYGTFSYRHANVLAHRFVYEHFKGAIPAGLHLDHLCRHPWCVNPEHLEPVTCRENLLRGIGPPAVNAAKTVCSRGHPLTEGNVQFKRGHRICLECRKIYNKRQYDRTHPNPKELF